MARAQGATGSSAACARCSNCTKPGASGRCTSARRLTGMPGDHEFITTAPARDGRSARVSTAWRCATPRRCNWRRSMDSVVPGSTWARGQTTASPSQKA
ncbi:conserved hypothetical protein, partial [Ricinus communis]